MLQPREPILLWRRQRRRHSMEYLGCCKISSTLIVMGCLTLLAQGLTQHKDDVFIVKPTPALRLGKEELTTVLLVNNANHGRFINVRPEVGLLTSTARTFIQEGVTTEYATQVVGTTLDNGRVYAQYLKKSSRVLYDNGVPLPSVVTSWVGESMHSDAGLLPQSHNDLFDADLPDWQAIDDRLLSDRRHHEFVGNTDYVGLRRKPLLPANSRENEEIKLLDSSLVVDGKTNSRPADNFVAQLGILEGNARKVAAQKVLPIGELPTYTIKPNAYLSSNDDTEFEDDYESGEAFGRNPKLIYKKLMQSSVRNENKSYSRHSAKPLILASRHFATVTYYGFADFTTVVGDSVIVFSPSTSTHNMNYNAHVTSIKGEATLGAGLPQSPSVSKNPIEIARDIIKQTITQQILIKTLLDTVTTTVEEMANVKETTPTLNTINIVENDLNEKEMSSSILETSEVVVQSTQSGTSSTKSTATESTVMLSRPSDEEILRIFNALANADAKQSKMQSISDDNITSASSSIHEVHIESSNVQIFGGATTIFFEDEPFANFVDPSKIKINIDSTLSSYNTSFMASSSYEDSKQEPTTTTATNMEVSTEQNIDTEITTDNPLSTFEANVDILINNTTTTPEPDTRSNLQSANNLQFILSSLLIKEIDPIKDIVPSDCTSTSQVFLTQLPKMITLFETVVATDTSMSINEVIPKIHPTFEIKEATKYYCIQASAIQSNPTLSATEKGEIEIVTSKLEEGSETAFVTEENNEEEKTETSVLNTTEENTLKESDVEKLKADVHEHSGSGVRNDPDNDEREEEDDEESSGQRVEDDDEDDEEIELIYKTLYTTYTYLTTFFHDDSTSISSHTEVVTNIMTSTLGISSSKYSIATNLIANLDDNEINPRDTFPSTFIESTKRFVVPSEVESFIRTDEDIFNEGNPSSIILNNSLVSSKSSETLATFYTTYTYYTTIFAEGETDIMSHTEVITNIKKSPATAKIESEKIVPTISSYQKDENPLSTISKEKNNKTDYRLFLETEFSSTLSSETNLTTSSAMAVMPNIPDLGDLSAITLVTDVRSSSSSGDKKVINNHKSKLYNYKVQQQSILEDQISSESNTDTDEIIPSATLLLQTSFTTFTYYTTMYSGDKTNVITRLETLTNTVTETLQPSKTIDLEGASVPITYFTTFTYWTKLAREGQITTLSREETISNIVIPTIVQHETETKIGLFPRERENVTEKATTTEALLKDNTTTQPSKEDNKTKFDQNEMSFNKTEVQYATNVLEATTYYTTYTYYTTSYETDQTITDSRFETVTNIITPTMILTNISYNTRDTESPIIAPYLTQSVTQSTIDQSKSETFLYDFKKIIDADGISTLFFTTEIKPTINANGVVTEVTSSTSSIFINEEKRSMQASASAANSTPDLGQDGQILKQYKTGLVRLIDGTRIANRTTTLYQSKVIGTVIDQRYAQIIESTSSFIFEQTTARADAISLNTIITPTSSSNIQYIQATDQVSLPVQSVAKVEGSITDSSLYQEIVDTTTKAEMEGDEDNYQKTDEKLRFPFQTKKPPFISPLKPFLNRSRPQFAPKKNSSATIITRSDFTPTITATPALKTISRFSSTRRGSASGISSSNSVSSVTSSKRFGRPSKSSVTGAGLQTSSINFSGASRNRFASSPNARSTFASSSRRIGGSAAAVRASFSRPSLFSSGFPGNSRLRIKPTVSAVLEEVLPSVDISTSVPLSSQEEEFSQAQADLDEEEENTTESNRRQNNPLLRLRRPLNRPQGFTPARSQKNTPNSEVSSRRNPLISRSRNSVTVTTPTTTASTAKPKPRTFQPHLISKNRIRTTNTLFPPRNIFGVQKPEVTTEENRDLSEEDTNENNDDSEYEDDDDEEPEGDEEEENIRRRRSNNKTELVAKQKNRIKREADTSQQNRSNFRNRFRRPKLASHAQTESKPYKDDGSDAKEAVRTAVPQTTSPQRTRSRFGARYIGHSSSSTTTTSTSPATSANHKAIRPTRPSSNGRAQFTLREKDSSVMSTTQKGLTSVKLPAFRRPQPKSSLSSSRRLPSSTVPSTSPSGKRRLKSYVNNDSTTTSRSSVTGRSRPSSSTSSGRSRSSGSSRENNIGGRNRGRSNHNYNNNNEPAITDNSGTITVTHVIPADVTIPVINGKVTEYKQVVTARTSTEVLGPHQYTSAIAANGALQLVLTREDSSVNFNGATEVTQYILHETLTTTITFTPTTIRGRKTSFSHVLPSTVYSVEQVLSTVQPQLSANAPLANILLSQLLLGNVGLPAGNPLLGALGGALTNHGLGTTVGPPQQAAPVTEYKTHASTYVTTVVEGQSTVLPVTFQGKKILTTIYDTTAQTITATEFITDTIVTTPSALAQPVVNSLLLQQLLLQQHLQQQQQSTPDPSSPLNAILNSVPPQFLLGGDNLQELEASNNIRGSGHGDLLNEEDEFAVGSAVDLDDIAIQAQVQVHKNGRKKTRKNGKNHKRKNNNIAEAQHSVESSVITLYVSGRRPGEFSTVLSTVQARQESTVYKRQAHTIDNSPDFLNDGSEIVNDYLALPPKIILLDDKEKNEIKYDSEETAFATHSLESVIGDVGLWYATQTMATASNTCRLPASSETEINNHKSICNNLEIPASQAIHKQFQHFDSGQYGQQNEEYVDRDAATLKTSHDIRYSEYINDNINNNNKQSQNANIDEARYNIATRIMSNGVEVIIASDKTKTQDHVAHDISNSQMQYNKPVTLAASTIKDQMMILLFPSSQTTAENNFVMNQSIKQLNPNLSFYTNHFITKTCLTTYTYRTTYVQDGSTTVESREKVISNIATEERNYPKITPSQTIGITLTRTPELAVGIFPTTYSYFSTFKDNSDKLQVITSEYTVVNTITGPNDYVAYLQPTAKATPALTTNTYYDVITISQKIQSNMYTVKRNLTQVVVTKSYMPTHSTSVFTSYYAYDEDVSKCSTSKFTSLSSLLSNEEAKNTVKMSAVNSKDKTKILDNIHIYATRTFLTRFTYYTTTILNSYFSESSQTELDITPLSTVFNYYTRVIENVITDSVPATLLPDELLTKIKLELGKQPPNQRRRVIVTTATLKGGQIVKISAVEMFKGNFVSSLINLSPTLSSSTSLPPPTVSLFHHSQENLEGQYQTQEDDDDNENFNLETSNSSGYPSSVGHVKYPNNQEEETNGFASLPSEQVLTVVKASNYQQSIANTPMIVNENPSTLAANQLIQRLTALKPMFNAMADLLQNNFGVTRKTVWPIQKNVESKQASIKKINHQAANSTEIDTTHLKYIPVRKSEINKSSYGITNYSEFIPQSLHIKPPPLLVNEENSFEADHVNKPSKSKLANQIPLSTLKAPRLEQPLHNGGIYIRPGEIITANSDVIIGKPNGIEFPQIPFHTHVDKNISNAPISNNQQFQVTYYNNNVQHPYKKKSFSALTKITHKPQHIPLANGVIPNTKLNQTFTFGLRHSNEKMFNKNILKPPPLPPTLQSLIPVHSQQGLSLLLTAPDIPTRTSNKQQKTNTFIPAGFSMQDSSENPLSSVTPLRQVHNFYNFNNELQNNEILETQQLPQVLSVDLKPSSLQTQNIPKLSNKDRKHQSHTSSTLNKTNTELQVEKTPTSLNWESGREPQISLSFMRLQPEAKIVGLYTEKDKAFQHNFSKLPITLNWKNSRAPQVKISTSPSYIHAEQKPNIGLIEKKSNPENLLTGSSIIWSLQQDRQPQIKTNISFHQMGPNKKPSLQSSTNLEELGTFYKKPSAALNGNIPYNTLSIPIFNNKKKIEPNQRIIYFNESVTSNHQNVSLDQHMLSHTVDVNVPPLTFNREDHDYPQLASIAVKGQIPPASLIELKTQAIFPYKYMPLITIPENKQQVQVSLTPLNSIGSLTLPTKTQNVTPWISEKVSNEPNSNNIVRKISLLKDNLQSDQSQPDQKAFATRNVLNIKPKYDEHSNWKYHRRQQELHNTRLNSKPQSLTTTKKDNINLRQVEEKNSQTELNLKSKPNQVHQQSNVSVDVLHRTSIPSFYQVPMKSKHPPQLTRNKLETVPAESPHYNKSYSTDRFTLHDPKSGKDHKHVLQTEVQPTQTNNYVFSKPKTSKEQNRKYRDSIQKPEHSSQKINNNPFITSSTTMKTFQKTTTKKPTAKDINEIINIKNKKQNDESLQVPDILTPGQPFSKSSNNNMIQNYETFTEITNRNKPAAIFVASGEAFRLPESKHNSNVKINTTNSKDPLSKTNSPHSSPQEVFLTRGTQYSFQQTPNVFTKAQTKTSTLLNIALNPLQPTDIKTAPSLSNAATTATVYDLQPSPLTIPLLTKKNKTTFKIGLPYILLSSSNENTEMTKKHQQPTGTEPDEYVLHQDIMTNITNNAEDLKLRKHFNLAANKAEIYLENESPKANDSFKLFNLQPSESYKEKVTTPLTSPLFQPILKFTTTTVKRIILPTKYVTSKRVYTVTTTAFAPLSTHVQSTSSILPTTETTTEVTTVFLTHTKMNRVVDTATSVKALVPIPITATTTLKSLATESSLLEVSSIKTHLTNLASQEPFLSSDSHSYQINQDLTYLPYPSVEVVSTNMTPKSNINPIENSIFIIMTNQKNKKNAVVTHPSKSQVDHTIPLELTDDNDNGQIDEANVMIEYDNRISFDNIPFRDEESEHILHDKSVAFSAIVNNVASVKESSTDDHIILGGVLIATPPKSPTIHTNVNESTNGGCHPKCKASRNEQCDMVDSQWSCLCRPSFARMFPDRPCKPTYTHDLLMHVVRVGSYPLQYVSELKDNKTYHFKQLSQLVTNALDRMLMQSDFRDSYHGVEVTQFSDGHKNHHGVLINVLLQLSDNSNEKRLEEVFKKHLRLSNYSIGGTDLYTNKAGVDRLAIKDFNECLSRKLNDCSKNAHCFNLPGTYTCSCIEGFADLSDNPIYPGRTCSSELIGCEMCHYHGKCFYSGTTLAISSNDQNYCECFSWYAGSKCQVNLKILLIVLLGIGTLLFILLLFCILITCTKRRNNVQHTTLAPSTVTTSSDGLQKKSRIATNLVIANVGLHSSVQGGTLYNNKRQKSLKIDKRLMIKDSSSESSQNSLPCALKKRDSITERWTKKKSCHLNNSKKFKNYPQKNTMDQYSVSDPSNLHIENKCDLSSTMKTSSFKGNNHQTEQQNFLGNAIEYEGHYCDQSDRSLTVMIPRAKYHSSVLSQTQLMHHQLTMERILNTAKRENNLANADEDANDNKTYKTNLPNTKEISSGEIPTNPGALISAGFEVSAIVRDNIKGINSVEQSNNDLVQFDLMPPYYNNPTTSHGATSLESNAGQKDSLSADRHQHILSKMFSMNESDYNVYKCGKDSAEARPFDETIIRATTKPVRLSVDGTHKHQIHDEVNAMAERDLGSTVLLPHTHLYNPERQDSELSGFDSF